VIEQLKLSLKGSTR